MDRENIQRFTINRFIFNEIRALYQVNEQLQRENARLTQDNAALREEMDTRNEAHHRREMAYLSEMLLYRDILQDIFDNAPEMAEYYYDQLRGEAWFRDAFPYFGLITVRRNLQAAFDEVATELMSDETISDTE